MAQYLQKVAWQRALETALTERADANPDFRVALLGVGNELRGDDGAGVIAVRQIIRGRGNADEASLLALDCGPSPENFTGVLKRFQPDLIILIDAAEMGLSPGQVRLIPLDGQNPATFSTHAISVWMLATYCRAELNCPVYALAIQMGANGFDEPLSQPVRASVAQIASAFSAYNTLVLRSRAP